MDDLIAYLINCGFNHDIRIIFTDQLPASLAGFSSQKDRAIWINTQWRGQPEYGFVVAHELGHLLAGDDGVNYYSAPSLTIKSEHAANIEAVQLIERYAEQQDMDITNRVSFYQSFGIPLVLIDLYEITPTGTDRR